MARKEVLLWSTAEQRDANGIVAQRADAGGFTDAAERHAGENNGSAQARLCPATGKAAKQHGDLRWMNDVRSWGANWSGIAADPVVGSSTGAIMPFDYITGGPYTRLEQVHVIDCAGFDYCKLYWQGKCLAYEGLAIDTAQFIIDSPATAVNRQMSDSMRVAAAGMPCVDSSDSMFSIPKMFRMNENDSLGNELSVGSANDATSTYSAVDATEVITLTSTSAGIGLRNDDVVTATANANGLLVNTKYFVVQAAASGISFKLSLTSGGAPVNVTTGTGTLNLPGHSPGSSRRGVPMQWAGLESGINWEPDNWISGGEPLWTQWRGGLYPGANDWRRHEQIRPALSFETSTFTTQYQNQSGPAGVFQWGKFYKTANDIMINNHSPQAGDKFETVCWIGYPNRQAMTTAEITTSNQTADMGAAGPLRISGLSRICLTVGAVGLSFYGGSADPLCWEQATPGTPQFTYLRSTPVGPAVAPREHIRGRLWAILFN